MTGPAHEPLKYGIEQSKDIEKTVPQMAGHVWEEHMSTIKRIEYKVIGTGDIGVPGMREQEQGEKTTDAIARGLNKFGHRGWVFTGRIGDCTWVFAREYTEPSPLNLTDKSCGNCKHWTRPIEIPRNEWGRGICQFVCLETPRDGRFDIAVIQTEDRGSTQLHTRAEFGCFMWEGYKV